VPPVLESSVRCSWLSGVVDSRPLDRIVGEVMVGLSES
jgi:hypothetical protein